MSKNAGDSRNGFKNSRIDLSQLGDDSWSKPMGRKPGMAGPRRRPGATASVPAPQRTHLDELFESRVRAAAARRSVKQSRGQGRVWMFAGGLFVASVSGVAAAYYLVGPPMAMTAQGPEVAGYQAAQTSSLQAEGNIAQTSSHFQGTPVLITAPEKPADDGAATAAAVQTSSAEEQADTVNEARDPVAPPSTEPVVAADATGSTDEAPQPEQEEVAAMAPPEAEDSLPAAAEPEPEPETLVQILPTAVSDELKPKTNVNATKAADAAAGSDGPWLAVPSPDKPAAQPVVTAAASQQSDEAKPAGEAVKSQEELFKAFQAYLKTSGHRATGNDENQQELFDKFMRWSVEARKSN